MTTMRLELLRPLLENFLRMRGTSGRFDLSEWRGEVVGSIGQTRMLPQFLESAHSVLGRASTLDVGPHPYHVAFAIRPDLWIGLRLDLALQNARLVARADLELFEPPAGAGRCVASYWDNPFAAFVEQVSMAATGRTEPRPPPAVRAALRKASDA